MPLSSGTRLGPYEILNLAGAGGMGEVYRAKDTRLERVVAIKVLPGEVAANTDRRQRFEREARTIASLSHPHICALHDVGSQEGLEDLVMEFLEGETLAARLARRGSRSSSAPRAQEVMPSPSPGSPSPASTPAVAGQALPVAEMVRIARELAEALAAAHRAGIVHRDLKPANIMLTRSGVKVLDFGLARLVDPETTGSPALSTATVPLTSAGVLLGTIPYMAPEQLEGREVDSSADIFAFGAIVFEMATGRRAFNADSQAGVIAAILDQDPPPLSSLVPTMAPALERLVQRCLAKNPDERWHSAHDLATELRWIEEGAATAARGPALPRPDGLRSWIKATGVVGLGAAILAAGVFIGRGRSAMVPASSPPTIRATLRLPDGVQLAGRGGPVVALSSDGRSLAFIGVKNNEARLYVQRLADGRVQLVPGSEDVEGPFFSPDGEWLAFAVNASTGVGKQPELRKYSLSTGLTQTICEIVDFFGGTWREDGTIFFAGANNSGMQKVAASGGTAETAVAKFTSGGKPIASIAYFPQVLPGNALLVETEAPNGDNQPSVLDLATGDVVPLGHYGLYSRYLATGHIVYMRSDGTLMAMPFDARRRAVSGPPVAVLENLSISGLFEAVIGISDTGTIVYTQGPLQGSSRELSRLVRLANGKVTALPTEADYFVGSMRASPDTKRLAVTTWGGAAWIYDLARNTRTQLPSEGVDYRSSPVWTPDGSRVAFTSAAKGFNIYWQRPDGVSPPELLLGGADEKSTGVFVPGASALLFPQVTTTGQDLWRLPLDGSGKPTKLITASGSQNGPAMSPDGKWLLYASNETKRFEIYLQPYPTLDRKAQLSPDGGTTPQWSPDGRTIYYRNGARLLSMRFDPARGSAGSPSLVHEATDLRNYQAMSDGTFLGFQRSLDTGIHRELQLIVNWFEEIERLAPGKAQ